MGLLSKIWLQGRQVGLLEQIACLDGAISAVATSRDFILPQTQRTYVEQALEVARSNLDEATFEAAFARGQAMSADEAISYARQALAAS
jgi:hypothetical protein